MVNEDKIEKEKNDALKISIRQGETSTAANGFGDSFIIPFAQLIGSNALHVGIISAFSGLLSPISQNFGNKLMEKHSRKSIVRKFDFFHALIWIPIAIIAVLYWQNILTDYLPWILIFFYSLIAICHGLAYPAWFSWMGDIVPEKERGKYFGKRNVYLGIVGIVASIIGSFIVERFEFVGFAWLGFIVLFTLAVIFKLSSFKIMKKQYEPRFRLKKGDEFSFFAFVKRYDNVGKFAVYQLFFNLAIMIASPFFGFYLLTELGLSDNLILFMVITLSSTAFSLMFIPLAGKISDRYGNLKLMYLANFLFALNPLIWLFSTNIIYLIILPGLIAGAANAALNLAVTNFNYDAASQRHRGTCIAYTNILSGIGVFIGALIGGYLIKNVSVGMDSFFFVFILAAVARLFVALFFMPQLKEVKRVKNIHVHPIRTIHQEINGFGSFFHHPILKKATMR